jgi:hypothetical protein
MSTIIPDQTIIQVGKTEVAKTAFAGNAKMGSEFSMLSTWRPVKRIDVCFTVNVIKGIGVKFWGDDKQYGTGDWSNPAFSNMFIEMPENDVLKQFGISTDPTFADNSVRGLTLQSRKIPQWTPGYVTNPYSMLDVDKVVLMGFYGWTNSDNFIAALGLWVTVRPHV